MSIGYLGNPFIKGRGVSIEWTPELIKEYQKCSEDVVYFTETYIKIITEDGLVPFILRDYQREMILSFKDNRFNISCMARQSGKCCDINTPIKIRSKKTGEILET